MALCARRIASSHPEAAMCLWNLSESVLELGFYPQNESSLDADVQNLNTGSKHCSKGHSLYISLFSVILRWPQLSQGIPLGFTCRAFVVSSSKLGLSLFLFIAPHHWATPSHLSCDPCFKLLHMCRAYFCTPAFHEQLVSEVAFQMETCCCCPLKPGLHTTSLGHSDVWIRNQSSGWRHSSKHGCSWGLGFSSQHPHGGSNNL